MMLMMKLIQACLLKDETPRHFLLGKCLGVGLLMGAGGMGLFFLFQFLVPLVGYLESGGILCGLVASVGLIVLVCSREKKPVPPLENFLSQTQEVVKTMEAQLDKVMTPNAFKILVGAFVAGLALYEMKHLKERKK